MLELLDRDCAVPLLEEPLEDMPFLRCEKQVSYCLKLRGLMANVVKAEIDTGADLLHWCFERTYSKLPLFYCGWLRNCVLEMELQQCTAVRNLLLIK